MEENLQMEKPSEIQLIANNINSGLKAFEDRKAELISLKERVSGLEITSIDDKAAIAEVSAARKTLKKARVEIEKEGKSMRDPLTKISKSISEKQYELIDIISPTENDLQAKEDWVKAENLKIEQAEAQRKQAIIQGRIDALAEYRFAIDITFLTAIDDEQFNKVLDNARVEFEKEQVAKAEADRLEQEKQAQIEKDREELQALKAKQAEADRIIKERQEELDQQARELKTQQEEAERKELERVKAEKKIKTSMRVSQLTTLGMSQTWEHKQFEGYGEFVNFSIIDDCSDDEWSEKISDITPRIELFKKEQEDKAEKSRLRELEEARQKAISEEQERQRLASEKKKEDDRLAEIKRQEDLEKAGDKAKWTDLMDKLGEIQVPAMRSNQYRRLASITREKIEEIQKLKP